MGFVGGLLGIGNKGGSYKAQAAPLIQGVNTDQINQGYNQSQSGLGQQQNFLNALMAQNGIGNQANVFSQQQGLANQLQGVANGTGPNPALQQFQNATGQNVANQAALMAGQRGAGANAGLLARQAAQQGAGIQQQAVGQGAALQAQQQLAGMNALQNQQAMMGNLAGAQIGQQANALSGLNQFGQNEQNELLNSLAQYNNAQTASTSSQNAANASIQGQNAGAQNSLFGGLLGAAGTAIGGPIGGAIGQKFGNIVQSKADGGMIDAPSSFVGKHLKGMAHGGVGKVPGKASVQGDSLKNDTVPAMLSPGEVVIPRHVIQSKDPVGNSAKFVQAIMAKHNMGKK